MYGLRTNSHHESTYCFFDSILLTMIKCNSDRNKTFVRKKLCMDKIDFSLLNEMELFIRCGSTISARELSNKKLLVRNDKAPWSSQLKSNITFKNVISQFESKIVFQTWSTPPFQNSKHS